MGRYTETIESLTGSRSSINNALSGKLADTIDVKFSEISDKIRQIETVKKVNVDIIFGNFNKGDEYVKFYNDSEEYRITAKAEYNYRGTLGVPVGKWKILLFVHQTGNAWYNLADKDEGQRYWYNRSDNIDFRNNTGEFYWDSDNTMIEITENTKVLYFHSDSEGLIDKPIDPPEMFE